MRFSRFFVIPTIIWIFIIFFFLSGPFTIFESLLSKKNLSTIVQLINKRFKFSIWKMVGITVLSTLDWRNEAFRLSDIWSSYRKLRATFLLYKKAAIKKAPFSIWKLKNNTYFNAIFQNFFDKKSVKRYLLSKKELFFDLKRYHFLFQKCIFQPWIGRIFSKNKITLFLIMLYLKKYSAPNLERKKGSRNVPFWIKRGIIFNKNNAKYF